MCPLFKKKDPTDIRNYCPIVALNESKVWGKRAVNAKEREW